MNLNKTLLITILVGIFATVLTPFIVIDGLFFPFITGKAFFFRILVEIIFGLWLILAIRDKSFFPKKSYILWSFVAFTVALFFSNIFGVNKLASFWSNLERMEGWVTIVHLLAFFTVLISVMRNIKSWTYLFYAWSISSLLMVIYGFRQLAGFETIHQGGVRLDGTLGNATYLATLMVFNIFFAIYIIIKNKNLWIRNSVFVLIILQLIILLNTATRGAVLGLVGGLFVAALVSLFKGSKSKTIKKVSIAIILGLIIVVAGLFAAKDSDFVRENRSLNRLVNISLEDKTVASRFVIWEMAFDGFKERPILGYGQSNFSGVFDKNYNLDLYGQEQWFDRAHNVIMDWLIAGGIVGLLLYLSIWFFTLRYLWKSNLPVSEKSLWTGLMVAYFFSLLFVFDNLVSYILFITLIAYIHTQSVGVGVGDGAEPAIDTKKQIFSLLILILIPFVVYAVNVPVINASQDLIKGMRLAIQGPERILATVHQSPLDNLEYFKKAIDRDTFATPEIRVQLVQVASQVQLASNVSSTDKKAFADLAISEMKKQIEENPDDAKYYFILGTFYGQLGSYTEAIPVLEKSLELAPDKTSITGPLAFSYLRVNNPEKALEIAREHYEKEKKNGEAWKLYVDVALRTGNTELVDFLIKEAESLGFRDRVLDLLEELITLNPNNPQLYISLASGYAQEGEIDKAIEVLEGFKIKFPDLSQQADVMINQLNNSLDGLVR